MNKLHNVLVTSLFLLIFISCCEDTVLGSGEPNKADAPDEPNETVSSSVVSFHNKCADILSSFVDKNGLVDYT